MALNPTLGWERIRDKQRRKDYYYRVRECYSLEWNSEPTQKHSRFAKTEPTTSIDLSAYLTAVAPYGTAIALYRKPPAFRELKPETVTFAAHGIHVFSGSGRPLQHIPWTPKSNGSIVFLGWSATEQLVVVTVTGSVRVYSDFDGNFAEFSLGTSAEASGVADCRLVGDSLAVRLKSDTFIVVSSLDDPHPKPLAGIPAVSGNVGNVGTSGPSGAPSSSASDVSAWTAIPPQFSLSRGVEVIAAVGPSLYVCDSSAAQNQLLDSGPYKHVALSPNGELVALAASDGQVWVLSADFQRKLGESQIPLAARAEELLWCGNDAVVVATADELQLLVVPSDEADPFADVPLPGPAAFFYDSPVALRSEPDGLRIVSPDSHELLQTIPAAAVRAFRLGSTAPAAILVDCVDHIDRHSPKADENLRLVRPRLPEAVADCISVACGEFDVYIQKKLLRAASFGKAALPVADPTPFVTACDSLRVLNAVRAPQVGCFLTHGQLAVLRPSGLLARLMKRNLHLLALRIAAFLHEPDDAVYIHWACAKLQDSALDDDEACRVIVGRLKSRRGLSFEPVARRAYQEGRARLAIMLTEHEPRPRRQVPLLLAMEEAELALEKAEVSGDADLVVYVLLVLRRRLPVAQFFKLLDGRPVAGPLLESITRELLSVAAQGDPGKLLRDLYYQADRRTDQAALQLQTAFSASELGQRIDGIRAAASVYSETKERQSDAKLLDEHVRLLGVQNQLESEFQQPFWSAGLSLHATLAKLIEMNQQGRAQKVKSEFKVSDERFCWIKLRALVKQQQFDELYEWSSTKKPPIGYLPFYTECLLAGSKRNAAKYIPKCGHLKYPQLVEMHLACGEVRQAAELAFKHRDVELLKSIKQQSTSSTAETIQRYISQLESKRK